MPSKTQDIHAVRTLHQAGEFAQAEQGYHALLQINPADVEALHGLAILLAQRDDLAASEYYLQQAIQARPYDPALQLHLANIWKAKGMFKEAGDLLLEITRKHPELTAAYNNLGTIYFTQEQWPEAEQCFRHATQRQPDYFDAYYNLGLTQVRQGKIDEAIDTFSTIIRLTPYHIAGRFQLGCLFLQKNMVEEALCCFKTIEQAHPDHFETQTNLATVYLKKGALEQAKAHYEKALAILPEDTQVLFNLGVISMQLGNIDRAIQYYQRAVRIDPDYFAAQNNLGVAFLGKQHIGYALKHFREALRIQPDNKAIAYTVDMLSQDKRLLAAPAEYITSLFDAYADHYDAHLLKALDYQVPQLLAQAVTSVRPLMHTSLDILDLGCGTGLSGTPFKPFAQQLIGVDLSGNMLEVAKSKEIYDGLIQADLLAYLTRGRDQQFFDLILCADVLVYMGELDALFYQIAQALKPQGLFVFNAEIGTEADYEMTQSGRFVHSQAYLDRLLKKNGLQISAYDTAATRQQNNDPVFGHLYVAEKRS